MELKIYTDETMTEIREVKTCSRIKIPYRVGQYVINLISNMDLKDNDKVLHAVLDSEKQITAVVQATFGLKDEDLEYVDLMELGDVAKEIVGYVVQKMADMGIRIEGVAENFLTATAATI